MPTPSLPGKQEHVVFQKDIEQGPKDPFASRDRLNKFSGQLRRCRADMVIILVAIAGLLFLINHVVTTAFT